MDLEEATVGEVNGPRGGRKRVRGLLRASNDSGSRPSPERGVIHESKGACLVV